MGKKNVGQQNNFPKICYPKKIWVQTNVGQKQCSFQPNLRPQIFGSRNNMGPEDMGPGGMGQNVRPRKLSQKKYGSSKMWVKKNVGPKNVVP